MPSKIKTWTPSGPSFRAMFRKFSRDPFGLDHERGRRRLRDLALESPGPEAWRLALSAGSFLRVDDRQFADGTVYSGDSSTT